MKDPSQNMSRDEQLRKKAERRRELANLPIEEKLKILVRLQQYAYEIGRSMGRNPRKPWK